MAKELYSLHAGNAQNVCHQRWWSTGFAWGVPLDNSAGQLDWDVVHNEKWVGWKFP